MARARQLFCSMGTESRINLELLTDVHDVKQTIDLLEGDCLLGQIRLHLHWKQWQNLKPWTPIIVHGIEAIFSLTTGIGFPLS